MLSNSAFFSSGIPLNNLSLSCSGFPVGPTAVSKQLSKTSAIFSRGNFLADIAASPTTLKRSILSTNSGKSGSLKGFFFPWSVKGLTGVVLVVMRCLV